MHAVTVTESGTLSAGACRRAAFFLCQKDSPAHHCVWNPGDMVTESHDLGDPMLCPGSCAWGMCVAIHRRVRKPIHVMWDGARESVIVIR